MKIKEWSDKNKFNSFSSWKGLLYAPWYQAIRDWKDGKISAPLAPVEASLDPIHACNLQCNFCNAASYLDDNLKGRRMTDEHLEDMIRFLGKWGVKGCCFGGGGEPTMHTGLAKALDIATECGVESSIATNGTLFTDELIESMARNCRWVGVSVDSACPETYKKERKIDKFNTTVGNITKLSAACKAMPESKCDVSFKFLVFEYNQDEIYDACKIAKETGCRDFHARPADWSHQGMGGAKKQANPYSVEKVLEQFEKCHELEDENFRVFTVVHKFKEDFTPQKDFDQCYAAPCCIQICADGNIYLCPDQRHQEFYKLGSHEPNPEQIMEFWGGKKHYDLVFNTGKKACNTRCTFNTYCIQCQKLFIEDNDPMCKNFI